MPNVPPLRFPEFSGEWEKQGFADNLLRLENGVNYDTNETEGLPLSRIETISTCSINYEKVGYCNSKNIDHYKMEYGDILFSHINSMSHIGKTAYYYAERPLYHGMNLLLFRCNSRLNSLFFYHLLNTPRFLRTCQVYAKQAVNQASISTSDIKKIQIHIPNIHEQNKIATFISLIDQRIETQIRVIDKLESLIKGIRATVFNNVQPNTKLGEIADIYQPQTIASTECNRGQYLVFGANGVIGRYEQYNHEQPQICITCRGNTCGTVNFSEPFSWITGNAMVINIDNNKEVNKRYLFHYLSTQNFHHIISGSGQPQIVRSPLLKFPIYLPSMQTQVKLAEMLDLLRCRLKTEQDILEKYQQQKAYLLQNMFI